MIKILIADDQELIRQSLEILIGSVEDFEVTDSVASGREVIRSVRERRPDIILMDIRMPEIDGVTCTKIIKENYPDIKIIILTTFDDDEYVFNALKFGASGYLLKGVSTKELFSGIRKVYAGTELLNENIALKVFKMFRQMAQTNLTLGIDKKTYDSLTKTELKIIKQVGKGLSNKEISQVLHLSEGTVRNNLSTILGKLDLRDRTQLAIWAVQSGIINEEDND